MILPWKLLFIVLKINDLIIKLFIYLYLVSIYDSYLCIFVCVYVYREHASTWFCVCILMLSLLFGIYNACVILFISHTHI